MLLISNSRTYETWQEYGSRM